MYEIAPTTVAFPRTPTVLAVLQLRFPDHYSVSKLPLADADRDQLAMRLESAMMEVHRLSGIVDKNPDGYPDPATGTVVKPEYLVLRLSSAVRDANVMREYLALNDVWRH